MSPSFGILWFVLNFAFLIKNLKWFSNCCWKIVAGRSGKGILCWCPLDMNNCLKREKFEGAIYFHHINQEITYFHSCKCFKINTIEGWRCGSSGRAPALQAWYPEAKLQSHQKIKTRKLMQVSWVMLNQDAVLQDR
jgi:hypothetical protein